MKATVNIMTIKLEFSADVENQLRERAASSGQHVEEFVLRALTEKLAAEDTVSRASDRNGVDWKNKLHECIDLHPNVQHAVDDSRESIYRGRGE